MIFILIVHSKLKKNFEYFQLGIQFSIKQIKTISNLKIIYNYKNVLICLNNLIRKISAYM
jgi:hypothetical protein